MVGVNDLEGHFQQNDSIILKGGLFTVSQLVLD